MPQLQLMRRLCASYEVPKSVRLVRRIAGMPRAALVVHVFHIKNVQLGYHSWLVPWMHMSYFKYHRALRLCELKFVYFIFVVCDGVIANCGSNNYF